jgi:REP element-mobilizing transposase RayT
LKYNPTKHHRRSIRLQGYDYTAAGAYFITICTHQRQCLFGEIIDGVMQLNATGLCVEACWRSLPRHFETLELDAFVIMPNHLHGILLLDGDIGSRGEAFGQKALRAYRNFEPNASPLQPHTQSGSVGALRLTEILNRMLRPYNRTAHNRDLLEQLSKISNPFRPVKSIG